MNSSLNNSVLFAFHYKMDVQDQSWVYIYVSAIFVSAAVFGSIFEYDHSNEFKSILKKTNFFHPKHSKTIAMKTVPWLIKTT